MLLDARLRHFTTYLYVQDLIAGAAVLEVGAGVGGELLRERGAASVRAAALGEIASLPAGQFDVAFALDVDAAVLPELVPALKRVVKESGSVVVSAPSRDRPGARGGVSYYELSDLFDSAFASAKLVGQAPFAGATLVEYGVADPEPVLDGTLVPKGERVEWYVAVGGPQGKKQGSRGYGVMQVPLAEVTALPAERRSAPPAEPAKPPPPAPQPAAATAPAAPPAPQPGYEELKAQLAAAHKGKSELQDFILQLKSQLSERDGYLAELDRERGELGKLREVARLAETRAATMELREGEARKKVAEAEGMILRLREGGAVAPARPASSADVAELQKELERWKQKEADARAEAWKSLKARSEAEAQAADVREDTVRKLKDARKLASVELMRAMEEATKKAVGLREELQRTERERKEGLAEVARLRAELDELKAQPQAEAAPLQPAPSAEAEAHAHELRELARAREEADAQVLAVRAVAERARHDEEVARRAAEEAERRAEDQIDQMRGHVVALERDVAEARRLAESERERAHKLDEVVRKLEREAADVRAGVAVEVAAARAAHDEALAQMVGERDRAHRLLADLERESSERAEAAVRMRQALRDREREVAALRHDLSQRDARLTALEQQHPSADEVERLEAELSMARTRLSAVTQELAHKDAQVERAAAAGAHERARAERLVAEERHAAEERNEARARAAEAESKLAVLNYERERAQLGLAEAQERARKAEEEASERKEKNKQLKRELEAAEVRLSGLDSARQRLERVEADLRDEIERVGALEAELRRTALAHENGATPTGGE
jgi:chromosome segregation ATPase